MKSSFESVQLRKQRALTLVELLVVVLILAVLLGIALPLYLSAVADSQRKACRANMQSIANAAQAAKVRMAVPDYTEIVEDNHNAIDVDPARADSGALTDLSAVPVCPSGGTYELRRGDTFNYSTFKVRCRGKGHGTFQPGVDSS